MSESPTPYLVSFPEPIGGIVVKRKCAHCGHLVGLAVKKEDGELFPLSGGEKVKIIGRETFGYTFDDGPPLMLRTPAVSYQGRA